MQGLYRNNHLQAFISLIKNISSWRDHGTIIQNGKIKYQCCYLVTFYLRNVLKKSIDVKTIAKIT